MKKQRWWNPRLGPVSFCVALWVIHALLRELLSRFDVVSSVLAMGPHVPRGIIACAAAFVFVRLGVFLLIPPILAWRVVLVLAGRFGLQKSALCETERPDSESAG